MKSLRVGVAAVALLVLASGPARAAEEVTFQRGAVRLAATLQLPAGAGPFAAVVLVHGSGPATRGDLREHAEVLAGLGLATLTYDKRGCGSSSGDWTEASLDDLADDAAAAVALLRGQPGIDARRVGVWGISQGGWVVPLVAARVPDLAFAIVATGGGATPLEVEWYGYQSAFRRAGLSAGDVAEASALIDRYFAYLRCGVGRPELVAAIDGAKARPWYALAAVGRILPSEASRAAWEWVATLDPTASIAAMKCPVLVVLGALDELSPTSVAERRWTQGLQRGPNTQVRVLPDAGHGLRVGDHHHGRLSEAYRPLLATWLKGAGVVD